MTMPRSPARFPNAMQAALLLLGDFLLRYVLQLALYDVRHSLDMSVEQLSALAMLLAHGGMIALGMHLQGNTWRATLHPSQASQRATLMLVVPPVLMLVPLALCLDVLMMAGLEAWLPLSEWEREAFRSMGAITLPALLGTCLLAPVLEELLFRAIILRGFLMHYPRGLAIWYSALAFGVAHLNIYQFCVAFLLGGVLGLLYERSRSLIPCIALHAAFNTAATLWGATVNNGDLGPADISVLTWFVALAAAGVGVWALRKLLRGPAWVPGTN